MDTIIGWIKSTVGFIISTIIFAFVSGYLIGNYYATKVAVEEPNLITPHNIISMTLLRGFDVKGSERYKYKNYDSETKAK
jgi:hypothetical protein